jgi:DNA-binding NtrC family response regulator
MSEIATTLRVMSLLPVLLLIDDEFGVRESLKMVFSKDYRVLEADSIDAAIPKVQEAHPDVVLLDVLMPRADGLEVLRRIKEIHPGCEVIMLTGVNSQQLATKAMDSGAFDFIGKPFDVVDLRQKVSRALAQVQRSGSSSA